MKNAGRHLSMDAPLLMDEDNNLYDVLRSDESPDPERELLNDSLKIEIERAISTLTNRESDILRLYYGLNGAISFSLDEIADKYELTRERVRQIKEKAIKRLKQTSRSKQLKAFLG
jgi:RNA polymerase primary sigma factor